MTDLVARLRVVIGDPAGASQAFSDEDLQAFFDERRSVVDLATLRPDTVTSGLATVYRAPVRFWESDPVLTDAGGTVLPLAATGSDPLAGRWVFASAPAASVYISGAHHDLYGAAATALTAWAAKVAREFDFATDNQRFDRSQKADGLLKTAREFARRAIPPGTNLAWRTGEW